MTKNHLIGVAIVTIMVGGASFYAGTAYGKGQTPTRGNFAGQFTNGAGGGFAGRGMRGAGGEFTAGEIISASNGSVSIKMQNGSSTEIVLVGASTQIFKSVTGTAGDLSVGKNVVVTGTQNSDGSLTAQSIQIRSAGVTPSQQGTPRTP